MWSDIAEQISLKRAQINQLFIAYRSIINKSIEREPDFIELSALATMLHSFYTGLDNIFKRIALEIDGSIPAGVSSHSALLIRMARPTAQRPAVISPALQTRLSAYLGFEQVFTRAYPLQLQWNKMRELVVESQATWQQLQTELDQFLSKQSNKR